MADSPLLRPAARFALTVVKLWRVSMMSFNGGAPLPSNLPLACRNLSTACKEAVLWHNLREGPDPDQCDFP